MSPLRCVLIDDDLARAASTLDLFALVESIRRLRVALHAEESAIKWLTVVLVILTVVLALIGLWEVFHR
jgi:hypothetical protein